MFEFAGIHPDRSATTREPNQFTSCFPRALTTPLARRCAQPHIRITFSADI